MDNSEMTGMPMSAEHAGHRTLVYSVGYADSFLYWFFCWAVFTYCGIEWHILCLDAAH